MITLKKNLLLVSVMVASIFVFSSHSFGGGFQEPGGACGLAQGTYYSGNGFRGLVTITRAADGDITTSGVLTEETNCDCTITLNPAIVIHNFDQTTWDNLTPGDIRDFCTTDMGTFSAQCDTATTNWELVGVGTYEGTGNTKSFEGRVRILVAP